MTTSGAAMTTSATYRQQTATEARLHPGILVVLGLGLLVVLSLPLLLAQPGPLTSDESLYVSEGMNLALGKGFTYTTGEPVSHRGPLFPALLAADFSIAGSSLDHARWVPQLFALANAALLLALGWRLFGREVGMLAAAVGLVSSLPVLMATSLFLDGVETFFLLLTLLFLHRALMEGRPRWAALAGAALGLAMLTKESALLWLPLPFVMVLLLGPAVDRPRALLVAYTAGFLAVAGWWWPYVYAVTGRVYLLGEPAQAAPWLGAGVLCLGLAALIGTIIARRGSLGRLRPWFRWLLAGLLVTAWGALFLIGLEQHSGWPFPQDYLRTVPDYAATALASWVRPLPLIALAWGYVAYRALRGSLGDRLLLLGLLLFLPFALFVANRDLHVRHMLPLVYLSYVALGRATIDFARWLAETVGESLTPPVGAGLAALAVVAGLGWFAVTETQRFTDLRTAFDPTAVRQEHWDNPLVHRTAAWIDENVPAGTPIMSGRLYYSQLYALTEGRYPWWQLPTVRVEFSGSPPAPVRASTLFRWEDHAIPQGPGEPWLYLRQYPEKLYYVALSERDLLAELVEHDIGYLVLTGDDAGFSSLSLVPYFEDHPAFHKVAAFVSDASNQAHIFQVLPSRLEPTSPPARVSRETADALQDELGPKTAHDFLVALSPGGYIITNSYGTEALSEGGR